MRPPQAIGVWSRQLTPLQLEASSSAPLLFNKIHSRTQNQDFSCVLVFCTVVLNSGRPLLYDSRVAPELGSDDSEAAGRGGRRGHAGGDIWIKFEKIDFRTKNLDFSCIFDFLYRFFDMMQASPGRPLSLPRARKRRFRARGVRGEAGGMPGVTFGGSLRKSIFG